MRNPEYLTSQQYRSIFKKNEGYFLSAGVIQSTQVFHFLCHESNPEDRADYEDDIAPFDSEYRNAIVSLDRSKKQQGTSASRGWEGFSNLKIAVQGDECFGLDFYGQQLRFFSNGTGNVGENLSSYIAQEDVQDIYGAKVPNYAFWSIGDVSYIGIAGRILKRLDAATFEVLVNFDRGKTGDQRPPITHISGPSENDLYFVSDQQNVFHFDGDTVTALDSLSPLFEQQAFHRHPFSDDSRNLFADVFNETRNETVTSLCHVNQGQVYVGTSLGRLFTLQHKSQGSLQDQTWIPLPLADNTPNATYPIKDIVCCQDRLFFVSGFTERYEILDRKQNVHLWEIVNNTIRLADVPEDAHRFAESLDSKHGLLLVSGKAGAALYDGQDWEVLIDEEKYIQATAHRPSEERLQEVAQEQASYDSLAQRLKKWGQFGASVLAEEEFPMRASMIADAYPIVFTKNGDDLSSYDVETVIYVDGDFELDGTLVINYPLVVIDGNLKVRNLAVMRRLCVTGSVEITDTLYADEDPDGKVYGDAGSFSVQGDLKTRNCLYVDFPIKLYGKFSSSRITLCNQGDSQNTIFINDVPITQDQNFSDLIEQVELEDAVSEKFLGSNYDQESIIQALKNGRSIFK